MSQTEQLRCGPARDAAPVMPPDGEVTRRREDILQIAARHRDWTAVPARRPWPNHRDSRDGALREQEARIEVESAGDFVLLRRERDDQPVQGGVRLPSGSEAAATSAGRADAASMAA
jgi:hypothetical protein